MSAIKLLMFCATCTMVQDREEWRAVYLDGEQVGYERTRFRSDNDVQKTQRETIVRTRSREVEWKVTAESDATGILQRFDQSLGRDKSTTTFGEVRGGMRAVETTRSRGRQWRELPSDVRSPFWFERQLPGNPIPEHTRMRVTVFEDGTAAKLTITAGSWQRQTLPNGKRTRLLRLTVTRSERPGQPQQLFMNEQGQIELAEFSIDGMELLKQLLPRAEAQTQEDERRFDITLAGFLPADRALLDGREAETAVYRVTGPARLEQTLNHKPRQLARTAIDGAVEVTVTASELKSGPLHVRTDPEYLKSTKLIDHREINVRTFAAEASAGEFKTAIIAKKLQRAVGKLVRNRTFSAQTAPASAILRTKVGDSTEHAVLLAALLRARRIPSRVAVGFIYLDGKNGFGTHMWTEAMIDGEWTALDATFAKRVRSKEPARVPGAGYLKVAHSSLPDNETVLDTFIPLADLMQELTIEIVPPK